MDITQNYVDCRVPGNGKGNLLCILLSGLLHVNFQGMVPYTVNFVSWNNLHWLFHVSVFVQYHHDSNSNQPKPILI